MKAPCFRCAFVVENRVHRCYYLSMWIYYSLAFINKHNDPDHFRRTGTDEIFGPYGHGAAVPILNPYGRRFATQGGTARRARTEAGTVVG